VIMNGFGGFIFGALGASNGTSIRPAVVAAGAVTLVGGLSLLFLPIAVQKTHSGG